MIFPLCRNKQAITRYILAQVEPLINESEFYYLKIWKLEEREGFDRSVRTQIMRTQGGLDYNWFY